MTEASSPAADIDGPGGSEEISIDLSHGSGGWSILLLFWSVGIALMTAIMFGSAWLIEQFAIIDSRPPSLILGVVVTLIYALLVTAPTAFASRRISYLRPKAVLKTWAAAGVFALFCIPIRLVPITAGQSGALLQIVCAAVFIIIAWRLFPAPAGARTTSPYSIALVAIVLVIFPWVLWGAAGSWLDSLLNLAAALLLGVGAAVIFRSLLLPALETTSDDIRANVGLGGLTMGTVLVVMGAAFGISSQQLILMLLLPALGWLLMGVVIWGRGRDSASGWAAAGLVIGLVAAAPMILFDTDELLLMLNFMTLDAGAWAVRATFYSALIALLLGVAAIVFARKLPNQQQRLVGPIVAIISVGLLIGLYFFAGQTGFSGERLFVIMNEQVDWGGFEPPDDYWLQRAAVYEELVNQSDSSQASIRTMLDKLGIDYVPYYLSNAIEVDGGPLVKLWLESRPEVDRVLISPRLRPLPEPPLIATDSAMGPLEPQWNLTSIGAPEVWQEFGVTGQGIVVGQADSGVEATHPELADSYRGNQANGPTGSDFNWFDPWSGSSEPIDYGGHGTHTLGSIVGNTVGVAPDATWIACVNLERNLANPALYLDCLQFLFAPFPLLADPLRDGRPELGAHVLNNSWGCPDIEGCDPDALLAAVQSLRAAGVFVVASAGNDGSACNTVSAPIALYDEVFSVGAVDNTGRIADFSSRGPVTIDDSGRIKPDIAAPGVDVLSSYPGGSYSYNSGTSMAGPHVVGTVALLWSANPDLIGDIDRTEKLMTESAKPYDSVDLGVPECGSSEQIPDNATGYGLIDAYAAVAAALSSAP